MFTIEGMISNKAQWINRTVKRLNLKENKNYMEYGKNKDFRLPAIVRRKYEVDEKNVLGSKVFLLRKIDSNRERFVFYLHGGAYAVGLHILHLKLTDDLADRLDANICIVDYPLAPEYHVEDALAVVKQSYEELREEVDAKEVVVVGDSAGGGLSLALAMQLREEKKILPEHMVLYSPWLDISLQNQEIQGYDDKDIVLNIEALQEIGKVYADEVDLRDYRVSPGLGNLDHLGNIAIFYGTEEIFFPDCHHFARTKPLEGTMVRHYPYIGMQHDWLISPILERELALLETQRFIFRGRYDSL